MKKKFAFVLLLLLLPSLASAANFRFAALNRSFTDGSRPVWAFWLCDTEAAMPTGAGVFEGDLGYAIDTNVVKYYNGTAWVAVDAGGGGGGLSHQQVMTRVSIGGGY